MSRLTVVVVAGLLASCSQLPAGGPAGDEFVSIASQTSSLKYELVEVTPATLDVLRYREDETFAGRFKGEGGRGSDIIGVGDYVAVTIWEAGAGGLFSSPAGTLGGGTKSALIPEQPVSQQGTISIPYAGSVNVAGKSPDEVKLAIEEALAGKAIEPQVLVSVTRNIANTVTLTGEIAGGGRLPLSNRGDRLLDVLSAATLGAPTHELFVQLTRGRDTIRVPLQRITTVPSENIFLRSGDVITVTREPQTFTAFGATGGNAQVPFDALGVTLSEAIAKVGGLQDMRADPAGVFVFRLEPPEIVRGLAPESPLLATGAPVPVVYRVNLRDPAGLFLAKAMRIYNKDLVYISNAPLNELQKFLLLVNSVTQPAFTGLSVANQLDN
ncbi:polysaccharide biosynthesis/export family protein [Mongoliimonas terrestris]|uniref:polysaccharide biosynthesis/export family protein n=1 Tax=Mongoliimonas terrestris TaxID=1709001 RepID=UPI0009495593|nr:polysaccharide biosynthesis/export family protein [Mongoliimonas terrestris]